MSFRYDGPSWLLGAAIGAAYAGMIPWWPSFIAFALLFRPRGMRP